MINQKKKKMKHYSLFILTAIFVGLFSCNQKSEKKAGTVLQNGWKELSENGYSVQYPENWDLKKPEQMTRALKKYLSLWF